MLPFVLDASMTLSWCFLDAFYGTEALARTGRF